MSASIWAPGSEVVNIDAESTLLSQVFTATEGQVVFTLTQFSYTPSSSSLAVFRNGQKLVLNVDYSETSTVSFSLLISVSSGELIEALGLIGSSNANAVAAAASAAQAAASAVEAANQAASIDPSKFVAQTSNTGSATIPAGTTAERPGAPVYGSQRANSTTGAMEWWNGSNWVPMGGGATGGGINAVFYENEQTVTTNYTITSNHNAMSAGPITINNGVTVTVPAGSVWSIV